MTATNDYLRSIYNVLTGNTVNQTLSIAVDNISFWFSLIQDLGSNSLSIGQLGTNSPFLNTATKLYISETASSSVALSNDRPIFLGALTNSIIYLYTINFEAYLKITGVTDSGSFYTVAVSPLVTSNASSLVDGDPIRLSFCRMM